MFKNKTLFIDNEKHFLLTNVISPNKKLYTGFEQIFFYPTTIQDKLESIIEFLRKMKYINVYVINSDTVYERYHLVISPL